MFLFTENIIFLKEKSIINLERGERKIKNTSPPKKQTKRRNQKIKEYQKKVSSDEPGIQISVKKFLDDLSEGTNEEDEMFNLMEVAGNQKIFSSKNILFFI